MQESRHPKLRQGYRRVAPNVVSINNQPTNVSDPETFAFRRTERFIRLTSLRVICVAIICDRYLLLWYGKTVPRHTLTKLKFRIGPKYCKTIMLQMLRTGRKDGPRVDFQLYITIVVHTGQMYYIIIIETLSVLPP